jgi:hypothetical protein
VLDLRQDLTGFALPQSKALLESVAGLPLDRVQLPDEVEDLVAFDREGALTIDKLPPDVRPASDRSSLGKGKDNESSVVGNLS